MGTVGRYPALRVARCWSLEGDGSRVCRVQVAHTCDISRRDVRDRVASWATAYGIVLALGLLMGRAF